MLAWFFMVLVLSAPGRQNYYSAATMGPFPTKEACDAGRDWIQNNAVAGAATPLPVATTSSCWGAQTAAASSR